MKKMRDNFWARLSRLVENGESNSIMSFCSDGNFRFTLILQSNLQLLRHFDVETESQTWYEITRNKREGEGKAEEQIEVIMALPITLAYSRIDLVTTVHRIRVQRTTTSNFVPNCLYGILSSTRNVARWRLAFDKFPGSGHHHDQSARVLRGR